jgi:hypothetical protein
LCVGARGNIRLHFWPKAPPCYLTFWQFIAYKFKLLAHASYERACELAGIAGFHDEDMAKLLAIYGQAPRAVVRAAKLAMPPGVPLPPQRQ